MDLQLPWPPKILNPNARPHWSAKAKAVKAYKRDCYVLAKQGPTPIFGEEEIPMIVTFHPPTKRKRDMDNIIAACKSLQDGLADAWGVNDSRFVPTYRMGEVVKGGRVEVKI